MIVVKEHFSFLRRQTCWKKLAKDSNCYIDSSGIGAACGFHSCSASCLLLLEEEGDAKGLNYELYSVL